MSLQACSHRIQMPLGLMTLAEWPFHSRLMSGWMDSGWTASPSTLSGSLSPKLLTQRCGACVARSLRAIDPWVNWGFRDEDAQHVHPPGLLRGNGVQRAGPRAVMARSAHGFDELENLQPAA